MDDTQPIPHLLERARDGDRDAFDALVSPLREKLLHRIGLKKAVEELPRDYRTAVRLARIEGLKIAEIAERMGRSASAVKNLLFKAMKLLQESFGDTDSLSLPNRHLGEDEADHEH